MGEGVLKTFSVLVLALVIWGASFATPGFVLAADAAEQGERLADEIEKLTAAIERLAELQQAGRDQQEQQALSRKLDTAIAYLNFRSRRIEMLEQDLQEMRVSRNQMDTILVQMDEKGQLLIAEARSGTIGSTSETAKARQEHEMKIKLVQKRMSQMDQELMLLEIKIQDLQDEISSVESFVQRHLQF